MLDLGYASTIFFVTLGPLKTIPAFFLATRSADRRTITVLAARSSVLATSIVLFAALVATGTMVEWRISTDAMAIAAGVLLVISAIGTLTGFRLSEPTDAGTAAPARIDVGWMARPVLSPLVIPVIVTPVGVASLLYFAGLAVGDVRLQAQLVGVLVAIMTFNFVAMLTAAPIMRTVGVPVLQVIGWIFAALQAGLGVEFVVGAVRRVVLGA